MNHAFVLIESVMGLFMLAGRGQRFEIQRSAQTEPALLLQRIQVRAQISY